MSCTAEFHLIAVTPDDTELLAHWLISSFNFGKPSHPGQRTTDGDGGARTPSYFQKNEGRGASLRSAERSAVSENKLVWLA